MGRIWFDADADADEEMRRLESDPTAIRMLARVQAVLDLLEEDPGNETLRRVRFQAPPLWCVAVVVGDDEHIILWEPHPAEPRDVVVRYLGPATFA